jgi:CRISPR-associated protein Cas5
MLPYLWAHLCNIKNGDALNDKKIIKKMNINLKILFEKTDKTVNTMLTIEPLAPLSMVSTMPGSFYKTLAEPSKHQLCGAFENALGWHFDENFKNRLLGRSGRKETVRSQIKKQVEAFWKKNKIEEADWESSDVGYEPLLYHLFDIGLKVKPPMIFYKDMWKQMRKRGDWGHASGSPNLDVSLIAEKLHLLTTLEKLEADAKKEDKKKVKEDNTKTLDGFFKENKGSFPQYYTTVGNREYIAITEGVFRFQLKMTQGLFDALELAFRENNVAYLGTSESWVNFKIQKL